MITEEDSKIIAKAIVGHVFGNCTLTNDEFNSLSDEYKIPLLLTLKLDLSKIEKI